jgi:hypothetical protein
MLTFHDLFWKQKEKKNDFCNIWWLQNLYSAHEISHNVLGLMSRLYSLGVTSGSLVAVKHNSPKGFFLEWAVWILGGGIVYWDEDCNIIDVFSIIDEKKVSHIIVEEESWYLEYEEQIDELYDVIHILCLQESEYIVPITPASYDEKKHHPTIEHVQHFQKNIAMIHISKQRTEVISHEELLVPQYTIESNFNIHIPINHIGEYRPLIAQYLFLNRIYFYEDLSFPYTKQDIFVLNEDFLHTLFLVVQQMTASSKIGHYFLQWYQLLLQQLIFCGKPSRRVQLQIFIFEKMISSLIKEPLGLSQMIIMPNDPALQDKIQHLNFDILNGK